jgi:hypothetical protein
MRLGLLMSTLGHAVVLLVSLVVLANPRLMQSDPTELIAVDIVPENEVGPAAETPPKLELPDAKIAEQPQAKPAETAREPARPKTSEETADQLAKETSGAHQKTADRSAGQAGGSGAAPRPQAQNRTAAAPNVAQPPQPDPFAPDAKPNPLYFPMLTPKLGAYELESNFDAEADTVARLTREEIASFQTHLQKCWQPPAGLAGAQNLSAVIRVALTPDGAMAADPLLVKASASAQGPALVNTAERALRQCQPFRFLPAAKYGEWKVLDLTFSPRGLAGG